MDLKIHQAKNAMIVATQDIDNIKEWCDDMCCGLWSFEPCHLSLKPELIGTEIQVYCFLFTSSVDEKMFRKAFEHGTSVTLFKLLNDADLFV